MHYQFSYDSETQVICRDRCILFIYLQAECMSVHVIIMGVSELLVWMKIGEVEMRRVVLEHWGCELWSRRYAVWWTHWREVSQNRPPFPQPNRLQLFAIHIHQCPMKNILYCSIFDFSFTNKMYFLIHPLHCHHPTLSRSSSANGIFVHHDGDYYVLFVTRLVDCECYCSFHGLFSWLNDWLIPGVTVCTVHFMACSADWTTGWFERYCSFHGLFCWLNDWLIPSVTVHFLLTED